MNEFGTYIKKIRDEKGMTLNQVALYAEISAAQLSRIETGKRGTPKPKTIEKIAQALKVDYTDLMKVAGYVDAADHGDKANKVEKDIAKRLKEFEKELEQSDGLAFDGEPMSDEAKESLLESMELLFKQTQRINKKFAPKKYRDTE